MSLIYIEELENTVNLDTTIRVTKNLTVKHIRPQIYRKNILSNGDLIIEILDGATVLSSQTINYIDLNTIGSGDDYVRGFIKFEMNTALHHDRTQTYSEYTLRIRMDNFTPGVNEAMYIVTDLNEPTVSLHGIGSSFVRGYEIYTIMNF